MKWIKRFFCYMDWHSLSIKYTHIDDKGQHVECKWCGCTGILRSPGIFGIWK
jgi:hypothetical protein